MLSPTSCLWHLKSLGRGLGFNNVKASPNFGDDPLRRAGAKPPLFLKTGFFCQTLFSE
jgi:hypothetical protein